MKPRTPRFVLYAALAAGSVACGAQSTGGSERSSDDAREPANDTDEGDSAEDAPTAAQANGQLLNDLCVQIQATDCNPYADLKACREVLAAELDQAEHAGCLGEQLELLECRLEHGVRCSRAGLRWNSGCELATTAASDCR